MKAILVILAVSTSLLGAQAMAADCTALPEKPGYCSSTMSATPESVSAIPEAPGDAQ